MTSKAPLPAIYLGMAFVKHLKRKRKRPEDIQAADVLPGVT
jgi:hypothetical protein